MVPVSREHDVKIALAPQAVTSATVLTGAAIDTNGPFVTFALAANLTAGTAALSAVEASDDGSTWTAVDPALIHGTLPAAASGGTAKVGVHAAAGLKLRCKVQTTGGTVAGTVAAVAIVGPVPKSAQA
jgi:hypothetical protein